MAIPPPRKPPTTSTRTTSSSAAKKKKLSQTRLAPTAKPTANSNTTTPQKKLAAATAVSGKKNGLLSTPRGTKPKPNASILSFFKKAVVEEEGLFIAGGGGGNTQGDDDDDNREGQMEQDAVPSSPTPVMDGGGGDEVGVIAGGGKSEEEGRFNELAGPVKRRRVGSSSAGPVGGGPDPTTTKTAMTAPVGKKRAGNPFLDDSDSDDDDDEVNDETLTTRVRLPHPALFEDPDPPDAGPVELTSGVGFDREVPLLRQQTSGDEDGGEGEERDGDMPGDKEYDDFTGEEMRAMLEMEAQARLEAGEEGLEYGLGDDDGESMTEACPVCGGSLAGATPDQATAHVNSCLDGNPTPLPQLAEDGVEMEVEFEAEVEATAMSKRFAKAAVPRPGQANPISFGETGGPSNSAFTKLMSGHAEDAAWATAAAAENSSRGMPAYKRTCPFYKIMPGFSICVDAFRYGAVEGCQAYFLSHFHSDHYIGLTANWTHGPIYCSAVTGSLVKSQLRTAAKYVVELEFEKTVAVPGTKGVTVTMIPANHCPGSSMFLFEKTAGGRTQRILHCGDFRACPAHVEHPKLHPETVDAITGRTKEQKIDVCYLDTTYLNPRYSFPPQDDVVQACAELCARLNDDLLADDTREWDALQRRRERKGAGNTESVTKFFTAASASASSAAGAPKPPPPGPPNAFTALSAPRHNPKRLLVVCGTYSIGKERICVAIAKALRSKIYAAPAKARICQQLADAELEALLTPDPAEAQVHMQALAELRPDTLAEYLAGFKARREFARVVGFRPSGWNYRPPAPVNGAGVKASANLAPSSLPTPELLHSVHWRPRFRLADLVPQRGGGDTAAEAMCFGVPYSEHSSFRELALFVMALPIERVVPTVNVGSEKGRAAMRGWIERWIGERKRWGAVKVVGEAEGKESIRDGKGRGRGVCW